MCSLLLHAASRLASIAMAGSMRSRAPVASGLLSPRPSTSPETCGRRSGCSPLLLIVCCLFALPTIEVDGGFHLIVLQAGITTAWRASSEALMALPYTVAMPCATRGFQAAASPTFGAHHARAGQPCK
jgi:hypothetical protein